MSDARQLSLDFALRPASRASPPLPDAAARTYATDPRHNVVLEASAGTGKTTVLVGRYLNLLRAAVDPKHILAITFTRKAAAEMRERIVDELRRAAQDGSAADRARWLALRDRLGDIGISTIDAFCFSLLREFPLEADLDPGFTLADETEVARLIEEALDHALRVCQVRARRDEDVALVFAHLSLNRLRHGLSRLLQRRVVASQALDRYVRLASRDLTADQAAADLVADLQRIFATLPGGPSPLAQWLTEGPVTQPRFALLAADLERLGRGEIVQPPDVRALADDLRAYFITRDGRQRQRPPYAARDHRTPAAYQRHRALHAQLTPQVVGALDRFGRALNVVLARGVRRIFGVALDQYRRTLQEHGALDFSEVLACAVRLLRQMDEFSQSRYRLESRYHHVLVDEFQDTSRLQWQLISSLVQSWGEGFGLVHDAPLAPSLFLVGDRKQSIYRFRDADVGLLDEAAREIAGLRPDRPDVRRSISHSFRSRPELLAFTNDLFAAMDEGAHDLDAFRYRQEDHFPVESSGIGSQESGIGSQEAHAGEPAIGLAVADTAEACAGAVAEEITRLLGHAEVRDRQTKTWRAARAGDVAILFRSRESHREFEAALDARGIPSYVYKGLGFYDTDEIKDLIALIRYLAAPESSLRAAAFLRSRFVRLSDRGLRLLAPNLASALTDAEPPPVVANLDREDQRVLVQARHSVPRWLALVDHVPQGELLDQIMSEAAYAFEWRGPRRAQARENVKKLRGLVRRIENRGYATLARIADHLDRLSAGDESNAMVDGGNAVNLMTIHAAKGLEFPIVFVVNLARGTGGMPEAVRVVLDRGDGASSVAVGAGEPAVEALEQQRDREETKRLLYVAVTRARDRLYLATLLREQTFKPGRGSLGEVIPSDFRHVIETAHARAREGGALTWVGSTGAHALYVCRAPHVVIETGANRESVAIDESLPAALASLQVSPTVARVSVIEVARGRAEKIGKEVSREAAGGEAPSTDVLVGRLVHRLLRFGLSPEEDAAVLAARARALIDAEERLSATSIDHLIDAAVAFARAIHGRDEVVRALASGDVYYEVPFAIRAGLDDSTRLDTVEYPDLLAGSQNPNGWIVRGTIDCLVVGIDEVCVIEFKTGRSRPADQRQLDLYVRAAEAVYSSRRVRGLLVYP
ncbi:MAG: AAA family ATPase [Luteitalea sp.]|nr:AAA family ATPase [Luteitalea sp.]